MRLVLPDYKKFVHQETIELEWGHMDALHHVHHVSYFYFFEKARLSWMVKVGAFKIPSQIGPVMVSTFCNYYQQLVFPDTICCRLYVSDATRASFGTWATLHHVDTPEIILAEGGGTIVWVDYTAGKSVDLPQHVRALVA